MSLTPGSPVKGTLATKLLFAGSISTDIELGNSFNSVDISPIEDVFILVLIPLESDIYTLAVISEST